MAIMEKFFGRRINKKGQEVPDPTPVELPLGYKAPLPLDVRMRQMIRGVLSDVASSKGEESFEEANDFEVGDDDAFMFPDEDDAVAANDPYLEAGFEKAKSELKERIEKRSKSVVNSADLDLSDKMAHSNNLRKNVLGDTNVAV